MSEHCYIHGCNYSEGRTCPECRADRTEAAYDAVRDAVEDAKVDVDDFAYKVNNPGQYRCPRCLLLTLIRDARYSLVSYSCRRHARTGERFVPRLVLCSVGVPTRAQTRCAEHI
jgi:hypothetical protein